MKQKVAPAEEKISVLEQFQSGDEEEVMKVLRVYRMILGSNSSGSPAGSADLLPVEVVD